MRKSRGLSEKRIKEAKMNASNIAERCINIIDSEDFAPYLVGKDITDARDVLGYWYILDHYVLNDCNGYYNFVRSPNRVVELWTEHNKVVKANGIKYK